MTGVAERYVVRRQLDLVADRHLIHPEVILGPSRRKEVVAARIELIQRCREAGVTVATLASVLKRHTATIRKVPPHAHPSF